VGCPSILVLFPLDLMVVETWIREALDMDIIKQSGPWYELPDISDKLMGLNNVKNFYLENPDKFETLKEAVGG